MVQINGKYKLEKNTNFVEFFVAFGASQEEATKGDALRPTLEITLNGEEITLNSDSGFPGANTKLVLGKEVEEILPNGHKVQSIAKLDDDTLTVETKAASGNAGSRVYKFSDSGLVITLKGADEKIPVATREYKRI